MGVPCLSSNNWCVAKLGYKSRENIPDQFFLLPSTTNNELTHVMKTYKPEVGGVGLKLALKTECGQQG